MSISKTATLAILIAIGAGTTAVITIAFLDFRLGVPLQQGLPLVGVCLFFFLAAATVRFRRRAPASDAAASFRAAHSGTFHTRPQVSLQAAILVRSRIAVHTPTAKKAAGA